MAMTVQLAAKDNLKSEERNGNYITEKKEKTLNFLTDIATL